MASPVAALDKIVSIFTIPCLQDCTTIISCDDDNEKQQRLQEIAARVSALYADYFTKAGTQKLIDALVDTGYIDQKDKKNFERQVKRDFTELDSKELNSFQGALKARIIQAMEIEDRYSKNRHVSISQKDVGNSCILGEAIRDAKLNNNHNLIFIAFFPFTRCTDIDWGEGKKEFKVTVFTPKANTLSTW